MMATIWVAISWGSVTVWESVVRAYQKFVLSMESLDSVSWLLPAPSSDIG
jgi:hypothetical protein